MSVATKNNSQFSDNSKILPSGQLLDSPGAAQQVNSWCYELAEIMTYMGLNPTMKAFEIMAQDLSKLAKHKPVWTKKYIHSVYHSKIEPSPLLMQTINKMAQMIDGTPASIAGTAVLRCFGNPDAPEWTLIPPGLKRVKCARPGCPVFFYKASPNQKYCCEDCRKDCYAA